jgi:hypothetical protein
MAWMLWKREDSIGIISKKKKMELCTTSGCHGSDGEDFCLLGGEGWGRRELLPS